MHSYPWTQKFHRMKKEVCCINAFENGTYAPQQRVNKWMCLSVGFSRSSNTGFIAGSTSQQSEFNNTNTCMNTHTHSLSHSNMPRHTHSNTHTHPSMAGHTQTHTRPSVSNFSVAPQPFLDSSTADTQHYIGKNTAFSLSVTVNHGEILTNVFFISFSKIHHSKFVTVELWI